MARYTPLIRFIGPRSQATHLKLAERKKIDFSVRQTTSLKFFTRHPTLALSQEEIECISVEPICWIIYSIFSLVAL